MDNIPYLGDHGFVPEKTNKTGLYLGIAVLVGVVVFIAVLIFTLMSYNKDEDQDYPPPS